MMMFTTGIIINNTHHPDLPSDLAEHVGVVDGDEDCPARLARLGEDAPDANEDHEEDGQSHKSRKDGRHLPPSMCCVFHFVAFDLVVSVC